MDRGSVVIPADNISDELGDIIADILGIDPGDVVPELARGDIAEWDSLAHLRLMTAIEERFGVRFTMQEIEDLSSVEALRQAIATRAS